MKNSQKLVITGAALLFVLLSTPAHAATVTVFTEDFSDNSAGWSLGPDWEIGSAWQSPPWVAQDFGDPGLDNTSTADNGIAGVIIGGNPIVSFPFQFRYLTSPIVDVSGESNLNLTFYRWLNSDYMPFMQNTIEVFDGAAWVTIWLTGILPGITDSAWALQSFDVSAQINSAFAVRFGYRIASTGALSFSSWNIDDVALTSTVPLPASVWLLGSALGLLGCIKRRCQQSSGRFLEESTT